MYIPVQKDLANTLGQRSFKTNLSKMFFNFFLIIIKPTRTI